MIVEYNGGLTREQFLFYEMRATAKLVVQGLTAEEIHKRVREENLFQHPTEKMIKNLTDVCLRRLQALPSPQMVQLMAEAPMACAKQVDLYAMMKYNRVVWDFMTTVIGEKYRTLDMTFSKKDVNVFITGLREQNDAVAAWTDATVAKIKQVLVKLLTECEFLDSTKATQLNNVAVEPELEELIREAGDTAALPAFNCFR